MKGRVDKSMGIVTLIDEDFAKSNLQSPLYFLRVKLARNETAQIPQVIIQLKY